MILMQGDDIYADLSRFVPRKPILGSIHLGSSLRTHHVSTNNSKTRCKTYEK